MRVGPRWGIKLCSKALIIRRNSREIPDNLTLTPPERDREPILEAGPRSIRIRRFVELCRLDSSLSIFTLQRLALCLTLLRARNQQLHLCGWRNLLRTEKVEEIAQ